MDQFIVLPLLSNIEKYREPFILFLFSFLILKCCLGSLSFGRCLNGLSVLQAGQIDESKFSVCFLQLLFWGEDFAIIIPGRSHWFCRLSKESSA